MTYLRDIQRQKARSDGRGSGYGSEVFNFGVNNKNVAITINEHIAGNYVPDLIQFVSETPLAILLHKPDSGHVGVYHNLCGGGGHWLRELAVEQAGQYDRRSLQNHETDKLYQGKACCASVPFRAMQRYRRCSSGYLPYRCSHRPRTCRSHYHWDRELPGRTPASSESSSHRPWPFARPCAVPFQKESHLLGQFQIALHVVGKVSRAHRRLLRFGDFPHLALRRLLVKLI